MRECEPEYGAVNTLIPKAATMNRVRGIYRTRDSIHSIEDRGKIINIRKLRKLERWGKDPRPLIKLRKVTKATKSGKVRKLENGASLRTTVGIRSGERMIHHLVWMAPRQLSCLLSDPVWRIVGHLLWRPPTPGVLGLFYYFCYFCFWAFLFLVLVFNNNCHAKIEKERKIKTNQIKINIEVDIEYVQSVNLSE